MKNIEIKISKTSRMVYLKNGNIGNDGENLQEKFVFYFQDKFVDGQARLEYLIGKEKHFAVLTKVGETYELPIKNVITKEGQVDMQLVITEGTDENEIPVFKSNVFYVVVNKSINAETEEPDGYAQWLDIANTKLNSINEAVLGVQEAVDYAKEQGDYAKEQANNVISASEEASEIIRHFESDVEEYTSAFNKNVENKTTEFNTNATNKVKEYNENATSKVREYNVNADNRINDFNQNADSYLDAIISKNNASGVPIYVDDAVEYKVLNLGAKGNYKQETTQGQQLFNYKDATQVASDVSVDENGWITVTCDNTNGTDIKYLNYWTNNLNLKPDTDYLIVTEIRNVSGLGALQIISRATNNGQFVKQHCYQFSDLSNNNVILFTEKTISSFEGIYYGLRTFASFSAGRSGSITFRISVLEDTTVTPETFVYEKYTGEIPSPNPDYPQEIEVIEGDVSYRSVGKNLLNPFVNFQAGYTVNKNGVTFTINDDGTITANGTATANATLDIYGSWNGTASYLDLDTTKTYQLRNFGVENQNVAIFLRSLTNNTYTTHNSANYSSRVLNNAEKIVYFSIQVNSGTTVNNYVFKPQLEEDIATDYEPYQETITPIDLKGNFVGELPNGVADNLLYKDRHIYLEKNVGKIVLGGSEVWRDRPNYTYADRFVAEAMFPNNYRDISSNYFIFTRTLSDTYPSAVNNGMQLVINFSAKGTTTLAQFREWITKHKPEVYYQLTTPELIDLGEYDLSTLQGTNNISLLANIEPTEMNMTYAQNIKIYTDRTITQQIVGTLGGEY